MAKLKVAKKLGGRKGQTTAVVFSKKDGAALGTIALTGVAAGLHQSPERIKELMDLLELPDGTDARVFAKVSSVIVR